MDITAAQMLASLPALRRVAAAKAPPAERLAENRIAGRGIWR